MNTDFTASLAFTLTYEGGKVDDPRDPGGRTCDGVTQATFDDFLKKADRPILSVYSMLPSECSEIYTSLYWVPIGCAALPAGVDLISFDIGVNMGIGRIRPWLLQSHNLAPIARINWLHSKRVGFWRLLPTWLHFHVGWLRRESACLAKALQMAKTQEKVA